MLCWMSWCLVLAVMLASLELCPAETCEEITDLDLKHSIAGPALRVRLLLFTRANSTCGYLLSHDDPFSNPEFNVSRPTTFIIHGYRPTGSPPIWTHKVVEATLGQRDVNVVVVDWNRGATNINYLKVVENTPLVATNLTAFIQKMQIEGASLSSIHMIGVSLGAHISGFTGSSFNGSIGRITALDPAGPSFTDKPADQRLDPSDAQFVDALHTDMDAFGFRKPLGHVDFYANGGADQPGCPKSIFSGSAYFKCDHQRSVFLYVDSFIESCGMTAYPCANYSAYLDGKCLSCDQFGSVGCPVFGPHLVRWKDILVKLGQTSTYFATNQISPYCQTNYKVEIVTWNSQPRWGFISIKLHSASEEVLAQTLHTSTKFEQYVETTLLARFDRRVRSVEKITLKYSTANVCTGRYKLRLLRIRLTPLDRSTRPLCRYDLVLMENTEVTFRPIYCEDSNF
ncbi:lipase member H [Brachyhypopomus gauderio]|uniref:lipase member H n=1 Tax=Brachyhypopomus gauderio TaxID=698409 RepID=UPI004041FDB1